MQDVPCLPHHMSNKSITPIQKTSDHTVPVSSAIHIVIVGEDLALDALRFFVCTIGSKPREIIVTVAIFIPVFARIGFYSETTCAIRIHPPHRVPAHVPIQADAAIVPDGIPRHPPSVTGIVIPVCAENQSGFGVGVVPPLTVVAYRVA